MSHEQGWIGVDLDSTLSIYTQGDFNQFIIGPPIPKMVNRVKKWISEGKNVKIFTARVNPETVTKDVLDRIVINIEHWCLEHLGKVLPVTCSKDYHCYVIYDDRAVQVIPNTGVTLEEELEALRFDYNKLWNQQGHVI